MHKNTKKLKTQKHKTTQKKIKHKKCKKMVKCHQASAAKQGTH